MHDRTATGAYLTRHVELALSAALADTPVVCLLDPRQCEKSTLALDQYIRALIEWDIQDVSQIEEGGDMRRFIEYLSYQNSQLLNIELQHLRRPDRRRAANL